MPVYEVRFLLQAETAAAGREAIRIPSLPHTEPILSQWGYFPTIDEETERGYRSTLGLKKSLLGSQDNQETPSRRRPRADKGRPKTSEQIARMKEGRRLAQLSKILKGGES